jgi:site-specific recombinase XerD
VTKAFLRHLQKEWLAQGSLVRIYATVRHFSRWLHRKFPDLFPLGCPTDGVKPPAEPTAEWKGLTRVEEIRLLSAAQTLRVRSAPGTDQGLRNHALLAVLLGSGLRVSEVLNLDRDQYTGKGFSRVAVKGGGGTRLRAGAAQRVARCRLHYTCNCLSSKQLPLDRQ